MEIAQSSIKTSLCYVSDGSSEVFRVYHAPEQWLQRNERYAWSFRLRLRLAVV